MSRILVLLVIASIATVAALSPPVSLPCRWRGTAPFCDGECRSGENLLATDPSGDGYQCLLGSKALCCQPDQCTWRGAAPFCSSGCEPGEHAVRYDEIGLPGTAACLTGKKVLCCRTETEVD